MTRRLGLYSIRVNTCRSQKANSVSFLRYHPPWCFAWPVGVLFVLVFRQSSGLELSRLSYSTSLGVLLFPSPELVTECASRPDLFTRVLGTKHVSLCLQSKQLINWTVSPAFRSLPYLVLPSPEDCCNSVSTWLPSSLNQISHLTAVVGI